MKLNIGLFDRFLRILAGLLIIALGLQLNTAWGMLGLVPFLSGLTGWSPLYRMLGKCTCSAKEQESFI
jgi:sulfite exporter TauE/SafE